MSDVSQGPGWWLASDGRWYPPYGLASQAFASAPTVTPGNASPRRPRIWPAITTVAVGVFCAIGGVVLFAVVGFTGLGSHVYQAPATVTINCHVGDYYVYQHVGSRVTGPGFSFSHRGLSTLTPFQVQVRGPDGARVATWATNGSETITKGSWIYMGAVGFHADAPGTYRVHIATVSPPAMIVGPSLGSQFLRAAPWLILVGVGGLAALVGIILFIVSMVRRGRQNPTPPYGTWLPNTGYSSAGAP